MSEEILRKLYYDPKTGLLSKAKFKAKVKQLHPDIPAKDVDAFVQKQELQQVNQKGVFKGFFKIVAPPRHFQMDVFFMSPYKRTNNNTSMFMIFVDILSRKMHVIPMKSKTQETLLETIKKFVGEVKDVKGFYADDEFAASKIVAYCEEQGIRLNTDVAKDDHFSKGNKLGIVDVATKTIKRYIRNYMLAHDTTKYINKLQELVDNYNATPHSSLKNRTPSEMYDDLKSQQDMYYKLVQHNESLDDKIDLDIGDYVRKRTDKGRFDKEDAKFSKEIYIIAEQLGHKYRLMDADEKLLPRKFKYFELSKVDPGEVEGSVGEKKGQAETQHRKQRQVAKELGTSYDGAGKAIQEATKRFTRSQVKRRKS
jgi:hypothetical protein